MAMHIGDTLEKKHISKDTWARSVQAIQRVEGSTTRQLLVRTMDVSGPGHRGMRDGGNAVDLRAEADRDRVDQMREKNLDGMDEHALRARLPGPVPLPQLEKPQGRNDIADLRLNIHAHGSDVAKYTGYARIQPGSEKSKEIAYATSFQSRTFPGAVPGTPDLPEGSSGRPHEAGRGLMRVAQEVGIPHYLLRFRESCKSGRVYLTVPKMRLLGSTHQEIANYT